MVTTLPITQSDVLNAPRGMDLLDTPTLNKGTAFTEEERKEFGLEGLLPPHVETLDEQAIRAYEALQKKDTDLERHIYGWNEEVESNAVEFLIHAIRKKIGSSAIRNVGGVGWMVDRPVSLGDDPEFLRLNPSLAHMSHSTSAINDVNRLIVRVTLICWYN